MASNDLIEYRTIYLQKDENPKNRIVMVDPILESEATGIMVLKSLRLKDACGLVLSAPPALLRNYVAVLQDFEKTEEFEKLDIAHLMKKLIQFAESMKIRICYSQKPSFLVEGEIPDLEDLTWTPKEVHSKLEKIIALVNPNLPKGVFLQKAEEPEDDVPVVRLLTGTGDPYTAERYGSLAFYSTQRGLEWYIKQIGPVDFVPNSGQVFITYYDDTEQKEESLLSLNLKDSDVLWAEHILDALGVENKKTSVASVTLKSIDLRNLDTTETALASSLEKSGAPLGEYLPHSGLIDDIGDLVSILYEHKIGNKFYIKGPESSELVKKYISEKTELDKIAWNYFKNKELAENLGFKINSDTEAVLVFDVQCKPIRAISSWKYSNIMLTKNGYTVLLERTVDLNNETRKVSKGFVIENTQYHKIEIPNIKAWKMANSFHPHKIKSYLTSWVVSNIRRGDFRFLGEK